MACNSNTNIQNLILSGTFDNVYSGTSDYCLL